MRPFLLLQHGPPVPAGDAAGAAASNPVFWAILLGYFGMVLAFGAWFARFNRTTQDFFFGGRRFSWWLITISIVATGVGSHSFNKYSGMGFRHGFSSTMAYMNDWFFMPLFLFGWLPIVYFMGIQSIPEYFERRFNRLTRILATLSILVYMLGYIGIGFLTMARTLAPVLAPHGWSQAGLIWLLAGVAGVYITFGGQTAVIFTDLLQGLLLLFAGLLLVVLGLDWLGGLDVFWNALPAEFKLPLADFREPSEFNFVGIFWQDAIAGSIGFLFLNQGLIMRFLACRSVQEGRKAAAFNVLVALPLAAVAVSGAGWIGRAISVTRPDLLPPDTPADDVFTRVASIVSSPAGFGFFVAAVTAALMSTVDTLVNAVAAVAINDVYRPILRGRTDRHYLRAAMLLSALATLTGVAAAFFFARFENLYVAHGVFHATATPPLVTVVFLGIFWRRFTTPAAVAVFLAGPFLMLLGNAFPETLIGPLSHGIALPEDPEGTPYKYIRALYNLLACFGVGIGLSLVTRPRPETEVQGLTLRTLEAARRLFKGGEPNDAAGERLRRRFAVDPALPPSSVRAAAADQERLAARPGDLVYVCDARWWLGGLRSTHAWLRDQGEEPPAGVLHLSPDLLQSGRFLPERELTVEKEL